MCEKEGYFPLPGAPTSNLDSLFCLCEGVCVSLTLFYPCSIFSLISVCLECSCFNSRETRILTDSQHCITTAMLRRNDSLLVDLSNAGAFISQGLLQTILCLGQTSTTCRVISKSHCPRIFPYHHFQLNLDTLSYRNESKDMLYKF